MAILRRVADQREITIPSQCVIGRSRASAVRLDGRLVSSEHAKLYWTSGGWRARDLGSRNGTFVDGRRLEPGTSIAVARGASFGFGMEEGEWVLSDAGPPRAMAFDLEGDEVQVARGELLLLPSETSPAVSVFPEPAGDGWVMEDEYGVRTQVGDGAEIHAGGRAWRLDLPVAAEATPVADSVPTLGAASISFAVSRDEERVEITIVFRGMKTCVEPREHGYFLLVLARARREDSDLAPLDRGWRTVSQLTKMLRKDSNWLYVATHRARQQLAEAGLVGAAGIVEVERGRRRLGTDRFEIIALDG